MSWPFIAEPLPFVCGDANGDVQRFMQTLNTAYAMYFRYKHKRPGHCWQGRYGAQLVQGDDYILKLTRYIHLNPVKVKGWSGRPREGVLRHLNEWKQRVFGDNGQRKG